MEKKTRGTKDTAVNKRLPKKETYEHLFLQTYDMHKRGDKSIYVRPEYHDRLVRIAHIVGHNQIPLYAYLDNILKHHFELFEKAIKEDYERKLKPIF